MKKIFLIGKNGQLGSEILQQAPSLNFEVIAFGREDLDITDYKSVNVKIDEISPDIVINTSAYHNVPDCEMYPERAFAVNAAALKNLSEVCSKHDIKFITYSTDYVFDGLKGSPYIESDIPNPLQVYGISKRAGENMSHVYCKNSYIIRTSGVYGGLKGSRSKKGNFVLSILNQAEMKEALEVSSEQIVSPTYSHDLASATLNLLSKDANPNIYHLVNEGYCSWSDLANEIVSVTGLKTKIIPVDRAGMAGILQRPLFSALSNTRARTFDVVLPTWKNAINRYLDSLK